MSYSQNSIIRSTGAKMKAGIHPEYKEIKVTCSCGHVFTVGSALGKDLHIEVCNECHPFYTGKQKIVDTAGRVERFKGKFGSFMVQKGDKGDKGSNQEASKAHSAAGESAAPAASTKPAAKKDSGAAEKKGDKSKGKKENKEDKKK